MTELVPMTSWSRNKKHLAEAATLQPAPNERGHIARPLCDAQTRTTVYDQAWLDEKREQWFGKPPGSQLILNLPACKRCETKAARLDGDAS